MNNLDENYTRFSQKNIEQYAELYHSLGFAVAPLRPASKLPAIKEWQKRRLSPEELRPYIKRGCNIGIVAGKLSRGLVVLDFDGDEWGEAYALITTAYRELKPAHTPTLCTGSGRIHIWIRCTDLPDDFTRHSFDFAARGIWAIVEVRANRCLCVAPPSTHPDTGEEYEWLSSPESTPIHDISFGDLLRLIANASGADLPVKGGYIEAKGEEPKDKEIPNKRDGEKIREGNRNNTLTRIAGGMRRQGLSGKAIYEALKIENEERCEPPLPDEEVRSIAFGMERYEPAKVFSVSGDGAGNGAGHEQGKVKMLHRFYPRPFSEKICRQFQFYSCGEREHGDFWRFDAAGGIWRDDAEEFIDHILREDAEDILPEEMRRIHYINEIIADIRGLAWHEEPLPEPSPYLIPFQNGIFDLRAHELRDYRLEDYFTGKLPWNYDQQAKSRFLQEKIANFEEHIRIHFWELLGYCLWRGYPFARFFLWTGRGSNGKSFLANIITYALGEENISNISLSDIQEGKFAAASLYRKLANIAGEIDYRDLKQADTLKKATGDDFLDADRKYRSRLRFKNYAKLIFLTNSIPRTLDATDAFYRRAFIVQFERQFEENPRLLNELNMLARSEEGEEEFAWLLTQAVGVLQMLIEHSFLFSNMLSAEEARTLYEKLSNPIKQLIEEQCDRTYDPNDYIYKHDFADRLNAWLEERGYNRYTARRIAADMRGLHINDGQRGETKERAWIGLRWKNLA